MSLSKGLNQRGSRKQLYDVFISFRGEDTRKELVSHLSNYLRNSGIDAFIDQVNIKAGEHIRKKLQRAIDNSNIYVPVFSKNYPESNACLWELTMIVENANNNNKQILPIFYGVDRDDVRLRTDLYANKLSQHYDKEKTQTVEEWKKALQYAAEIEGLEWATNDEVDADLCQQTLERIQQLIGTKEPLPVPVVNRQLSLRGLPNLHSIQGLELLLASSKSSLFIEDCRTLENLLTLPGRKNLQELQVSGCDTLTEIRRLGEFESLKVLIIEDCRSLKWLPNLSKLEELEEIYITKCPNLSKVVGVSKLESLRSMEISNCDYIEYVDISLFKMKKLENFVLENCRNLRQLGNGCFSSIENLQLPPDCPLLGSNIHYLSPNAVAESCRQPVYSAGPSPSSASSVLFTEITPKHTKEQEMLEELKSLIFSDGPRPSDAAVKEAALAVLSGNKMAADSVDIASVAAAAKALLLENPIKGDVWKQLSTNIRVSCFYFMSFITTKEADLRAKYEMLMESARKNEALHEASKAKIHQLDIMRARCIEADQELCAKMEADHATLLEALKNELHLHTQPNV